MSAAFRASVVMPVRNGLPDVLDAVDSALSQTLAPAEVIVVDDGSDDGSGDAVERRFGDRVRVLRGRHGSAAAARNAGWRAAGSEWIAFLDADDLWLEDKLRVAAASLTAAPAADWFFSDGAFRTVDGHLHSSWFALYADLTEPYVGSPVAPLFEVNFVLTSSSVVRRAALEALGGFDPRLSHAEDRDLWIRLARRGPAAASRRALVRYQHREGGLTRQTELRLNGTLTLFERLAADPTLAPGLRALARRQLARYRFKLGLSALREGRAAEARRQFARAWSFPDRAVVPVLAWAASWAPAPLLQRLRSGDASRLVAAPSARLRRVVLRSDPPAATPPSRAAREGTS